MYARHPRPKCVVSQKISYLLTHRGARCEMASYMNFEVYITALKFLLVCKSHFYDILDEILKPHSLKRVSGSSTI